MAADKTGVKGMSRRALAKELVATIDILSNPLSAARNPFEYTHAYRDLYILVSDDDRWEGIFETQPGAKSNYVLHALTPARVEWLKQWREREVKKVVNE